MSPITDLYKFFTGWVIIMAIGKHFLADYIDLFFLAYIVLCTGIYLSYINPKFYRFTFLGTSYDVNGCLRIATVDVIHLALLLYLWPTKIRLNLAKFVNACIIVFLYFMLMDIQAVYMVDKTTLSFVFVSCTYLYILVTAMLSH